MFSQGQYLWMKNPHWNSGGDFAYCNCPTSYGVTVAQSSTDWSVCVDWLLERCRFTTWALQRCPWTRHSTPICLGWPTHWRSSCSDIYQYINTCISVLFVHVCILGKIEFSQDGLIKYVLFFLQSWITTWISHMTQKSGQFWETCFPKFLQHEHCMLGGSKLEVH